MRRIEDDYNWGLYPRQYSHQLMDILKDFTLVLTSDNYEMIDGQIYIKEGFSPIHLQHKLLYETIIDLSPEDVHEVGCGRGNHLVNINTLANGAIKTYGSDISKKQLKDLQVDHPQLAGDVNQVDIVKNPVMPCDIVFTQAVLTHLSDSNLEKAIINISISAKRTILIMENFKRRDYKTIFKRINPMGWEDSQIEEISREGAGIIIISK